MTKRLFEARALGHLAGEYEAAITRDPRHREHRDLGVLGIEIARIAVVERHALDGAVEMIGPAVIAAGELGCVAGLGRYHHRAAVGALIVDHAHTALVVAHHHNRPPPDAGGEVVAGLFHLALVADVDPGRAEDALHLQ